MPADLLKAHKRLDRAVDRCYRSQPFPNERNRVEFLFKLYQQLLRHYWQKRKGLRKHECGNDGDLLIVTNQPRLKNR